MSKYSPSPGSGIPTLKSSSDFGSRGWQEWQKGVNEMDKLRLLAANANEQAEGNKLTREQNKLLAQQAEREREHHAAMEHNAQLQTLLMAKKAAEEEAEKARVGAWREGVMALVGIVEKLAAEPTAPAKTVGLATVKRHIDDFLAMKFNGIGIPEVLAAKEALQAIDGVVDRHVAEIRLQGSIEDYANRRLTEVMPEVELFYNSIERHNRAVEKVARELTRRLEVDEFRGFEREFEESSSVFDVACERFDAWYSDQPGDFFTLGAWQNLVQGDSLINKLNSFYDADGEGGWDKEGKEDAVRSAIAEREKLIATKPELENEYGAALRSMDPSVVANVRKRFMALNLFGDNQEIHRLEARYGELEGLESDILLRVHNFKAKIMEVSKKMADWASVGILFRAFRAGGLSRSATDLSEDAKGFINEFDRLLSMTLKMENSPYRKIIADRISFWQKAVAMLQPSLNGLAAASASLFFRKTVKSRFFTLLLIIAAFSFIARPATSPDSSDARGGFLALSFVLSICLIAIGFRWRDSMCRGVIADFNIKLEGILNTSVS